MKPIMITVTGADARVQQRPILTCGMVGVPVEFTFDESWQGLKKTAVFRAGAMILDVVDVDSHCCVPHELLQTPYRTLRIGVYGVAPDGSTVIHTVWADAGQILPGADPSGDTSVDSSLPVWQQIQLNMVRAVNGRTPDKNGNVQIEIGGATESAVLYTEQYLTDEQKAQARANTEAVGVRDIFEAHMSGNLLNMDAVSYNTVLTTTGNCSTHANYSTYCTTDFIPCEPGDVIRRQFAYKNVRYDNTEKPNYTNISRIVAYDENKAMIPGSYLSGATTYTVPDGAAYVRASLVVSSFDEPFSDNTIIIQDSATVIPYEPYGTTTLLPTLKPEIVPQAETPAPMAFLPAEICVAVGRTIEIYNSQVCPNAEKYHFRWNCTVGKALKRKFSITGTDSLIGKYTLSLEIYDDDLNVVWSGTTTLKIVSGTLASEISLCTIGDSLTNNKYWLNELRTLSTNKIVHVGTRGTAEGRKHEGRSGFSANAYLKATSYSFENEGVHPFWDATNQCFSWEYYKTNSGINPTAVQLFLGTNDLAADSISAEDFVADVQKMVDAIRTADSTIPIFVVHTICWGNQNGIGNQTSSDGFASQKGRFKYGLDYKIIKAAELLYNALKNYANVYFVPLTQCHDSQYNFGGVETPVNPRATQMELIPTEGVHPQQQGYEQMADIMYSVICAKLG